MSKSVALRGSEQMSAKKDQAAQAKAAAKPVAQLKPRRKLAIALLVVFVIWIVILYVMYFTTVYGHAVR
jgi:cell division septal protein FtsQ